MISLVNLVAKAVRRQAKTQTGPIADLANEVADTVLGRETEPDVEDCSDESDYSYGRPTGEDDPYGEYEEGHDISCLATQLERLALGRLGSTKDDSDHPHGEHEEGFDLSDEEVDDYDYYRSTDLEEVPASVWRKKVFKFINKPALAKFRQYHEERPEIFVSFYKAAAEVQDAGHSKYSAKCLMEVIRWQHDTVGRGTLKINNNYTSLYARLLMAYDPRFKEFFDLNPARGPSVN